MVDIKYRQTFWSKFNLNSRLGEKTLRGNGTKMIGLSFTGTRGVNGRKREGERQTAEIFALINNSSYMLKKIIKTHTARFDFVDIIKPTF